MGDIDVDFFLGTLKNLISDSKINYIKKEKHQLGSLAEDIKYLRESLRRTEVKRKEHPEVMDLVVRIRDVVSETENIVELFVVRTYKPYLFGRDDYLYLSLDLGSLQDLFCEALSVHSDQDDISDQDNISLDLETVKKEIVTLKVEVECILEKDVSDINGVGVIERKHSSTTSKEGFIHQTDGGKSLEAIARDHMIDLVERNLIMVTRKRWDGAIRACRIHDLLRELCIRKGNEDNFFVQNYNKDSFSSVTNKPRRLFMDDQLFDEDC